MKALKVGFLLTNGFLPVDKPFLHRVPGCMYAGMDFVRKSDFAPNNFSSKTMITCPIPVLLHFSIVRISGFVPDSYFESKLEQNQKFELLKSGAKSDLDT